MLTEVSTTEGDRFNATVQVHPKLQFLSAFLSWFNVAAGN